MKKHAINIKMIVEIKMYNHVKHEIKINIKKIDGTKFYSCLLPKYRGDGCGYIENMPNVIGK